MPMPSEGGTGEVMAVKLQVLSPTAGRANVENKLAGFQGHCLAPFAPSGDRVLKSKLA